jgi:NADH-quinone oxidoreductase subunit M
MIPRSTTTVWGVPVTLLLLLALLSAGTAFLPTAYLALGLLGVPIIGVIVGSILSPRVRGKTWGLAVSGSTLLIAISMAFQYDWSAGGYQFVIQGPRIADLGLQFSLGVDPISLMLVLLTALLHPIAVTASLRSIHSRSREHYAWLNLLLVLMLGTFMATDLLLFYVFFEASLVPLFFIIGIWGGKDRRAAANKIFIYTFSGSILMLTGILYLGARAHTFYLPDVISFAQTQMTVHERFWVLLALLAAFGVKTPLFPLHTWLPRAHTEAPTAGSVDLAALVLKLGTYGLLRIAMPIGLITTDGQILFPVVLQTLGVLCLIGILYAALVAWVQTDIKKVIAYSSVSHLGFCVLGMLALNSEGMAGSVLYMINHGIISGALFLIVGMIYHRYHTRDIRELSGLARAMPKLAFFTIFFVMASVGLPGLNGFVSEFLTILGTFTSSHLGVAYGVIAAIGIVTGAIYMLRFGTRLMFGPLHYPLIVEEFDTHHTVHPKYVTGGDITGREVIVLTPLAVAAVVLGLFPTPLLRALDKPLAELRHAPAAMVHTAMTPASTTPTPAATSTQSGPVAATAALHLSSQTVAAGLAVVVADPQNNRPAMAGR